MDLMKMKTSRLPVLGFAVALVVSAACEKAYDEPMVQEVTLEDEEDPWLLKDMSDQVLDVLPGDGVVTADFGGTRTNVVVNEAGTLGKSVWNAGDTFYLYAKNSAGSGYYRIPYWTNQGGEAVQFRYNSTFPDVALKPYDAVYPSASRINYSDDGILLGVNIPSSQTAVPGGFADNVAVAYARVSEQTDDQHFKSMVSLVRFRMSGGIVSQVKSVTLKGTSPLAGDTVLVPDGQGSADVTFDRPFVGDMQTSSVTLTGNFVAGQDYFIVLAPGTQSGFKMVFADANGHTTTKYASEFTFPRAQISDFGTFDLGDAFTDDVMDLSPIHYMSATLSGNQKPVTIAVIPEGFTAAELSNYELLAKSGIDALMNTEPFNSYREYFSVWILKVPSNESGASITDGNGHITTKVDSYFGARWGAERNQYRDMAANDGDVYDFVMKNCPDIVNGYHTIYEVPILMIINDHRYGGICHTVSDGRGYCMAPYTDEGGSLSWPYPQKEAASVTAVPWDWRTVTETERDEMGRNEGDWRNTLVHEFGGHCFSRLGDEYWYTDSSKGAVNSIAAHSWQVPFSLNISASGTNPDWKADLLDDNLQVKSSLVSKDPRYSRIGVYQGGDVSPFYRWRSEKINCMIDNRFYFSTWQRMIIVKRFMTLSNSTFDAESFWAKDVPTDPVRDRSGASGAKARRHPLGVREVPLLPPPVVHEAI